MSATHTIAIIGAMPQEIELLKQSLEGAAEMKFGRFSVHHGTLAGKRVVIVDDVISAGTSVRESVEMLRAAGATPVAVLIALDRMEKSGTADDVGEFSAVQMVEKDFGIPVFAIATLADLMTYLDAQSAPELTQYQDSVKQYRAHYGV